MSHPDFTRLEFTPPDWVMVGMPAPNGAGVWLIASKDLNSAELKADFDRQWVNIGDPFEQVIPGPVIRSEYTLTAVLRRFVLIEAADYPAAFTALFKHWSPEPDARPAISPGLPGIEGGPREIGP